MTIEQAVEQVRLSHQALREARATLTMANAEYARAQKSYDEAGNRLLLAQKQLVETAQGFTFDSQTNEWIAVEEEQLV